MTRIPKSVTIHGIVPKLVAPFHVAHERLDRKRYGVQPRVGDWRGARHLGIEDSHGTLTE